MTTSTEGPLLNPLHHRPGDPTHAARHRLPDAGMDPLTAFHSARDETMLDGNARLNLATFVTT